ncbi:hypothetical protein EDC01DRAFT_775459 [Geopyxis carbonaria]|nr:hypothetical protein EDC01DRAFT_775459 [Geopyxis carbonaria]
MNPNANPEATPHVCNGPSGCGQAFATYSKLRRHRDTHRDIPERECPLCPPGGKPWRRVDTMQTHLLNVHFPFELKHVKPTIDAMYSLPGVGRGWYEKVESLLIEHREKCSAQASQQDVETEEQDGGDVEQAG